MKAKILKQTEKAIQINYCVEIYGEQFKIKNWFPKSLLKIESIENDVIDFVPLNDWILDVKTKEYCRDIANNFNQVKIEIKTYLSNINTLKIVFCWI